MLRINLLPAYIAERRKTRLAIIGFSVGFAIVTAAMLGWFLTLKPTVQAREAAANEQVRLAGEVATLETEAQTIRDSIAPIRNKRDFIDAVLFYNTLRPKIFRRAAEYTYRDIEYSSMAVQQQTLSINAFAKRTSDVGRFLITMFGNPDLEAVSVAGIPGWAPPQNQGGGTAAGGGGAELGGGGYPGGGGRGYPGGGGAGSFPGGGDFPGAGGAGGYPGGGGGYPGGGGGGAGQQIPGRRGFPFTITGRLIQPVTPPTPPQAGGAAGGQAGGGFGGGGLGGYPGAELGGGGYPGAEGGYPGG